MAGVPVKLTFDLRYPDHARAYEILKEQKHTTQFVVNAILTVSPGGQTGDAVILEDRQQVTEVTRVTDRLPAGNLIDAANAQQGSGEQPAGNPAVTYEGEKTRLEDIPPDLLKFCEGE